MPLVLVSEAPTASGVTYDDVLGLQYEFPMRYRGLVQRGEPFAYYKGSRGVEDGRPIYFGVGVVGHLRPSSRAGYLVADVSDVEFFEHPVPARDSYGTYIETASTKGTNWQNGVRRISERTLAEIIERAAADVPVRPPVGNAGRKGFASAAHATLLEQYSVRVAMEILNEEYGKNAVSEMPPGNPGYDILVARPAGDLHVEVKGTVLEDPIFHLSEGQRNHAEARGANFRLIVVYRVNTTAQTHFVATLHGPLDSSKVDLKPEAWAGRVLHPERVSADASAQAG